MTVKYLTVEEAAESSGLHPNTLRRLLRDGKLDGYKQTRSGYHRWYIAADSLARYTDPVRGFLLDMRGPKLYLKKQPDDDPYNSSR